MTGAMRTCPTAALEVLMEVTPIHIVIEMKRKATLIRIEGAGNGCNLTSKDAENLKRDIPLLMQQRDEMPAEHRFAQNFSTHFSNKNSWTTLGKVHPMKPQTIKWYTDGSLTNEGSGLGVVGPRLKYHESMGRYTSIFEAEVCGIGRCAEFNLIVKHP